MSQPRTVHTAASAMVRIFDQSSAEANVQWAANCGVSATSLIEVVNICRVLSKKNHPQYQQAVGRLRELSPKLWTALGSNSR